MALLFDQGLAVLTPEGWKLGIGDPSFAGWCIAGLYVIGALAAWWARRVGEEGARHALRWKGPERRGGDRASAYRARSWFWMALLVFCALLGVNKQLDLQAWITDVVRTMAVEQGWHDQRRTVQAIVVGIVAGTAAVGLLVAAFALRRKLPRHGFALVGLAVLVCYAALRIVSFHHLDALLRTTLLGWKLGELIELGAVLAIALCAGATSAWWLRRHRSMPPACDQEPVDSVTV